MNIVFLINGKSGVGKDTFVRHVKDRLNKLVADVDVRNYHRSDPAKIALRTLEWDETRDETTRQLLADMVDWMENHKLLKKWEDSILRPMEGFNVTFYHVRDPKRYEGIKQAYEHDGTWVYTLAIKRDIGGNSNEIDRWGIDGEGYDFTIVLPPDDWKRSQWIYDDFAEMLGHILLKVAYEEGKFHFNNPKRRVYISGKITGTTDFKEKFKKAENQLKAKYPDRIIVNPAEVELPKICGWEDYMVICLHLLKSCDTIYMLPDWESSKGAKREYEFAKANGLWIGCIEEV